jgi:hypothetical protein
MSEITENRIKQWKHIIALSVIGAALTVLAAVGSKSTGFSFPHYLLVFVLSAVAAQILNSIWQIKRLRKKAPLMEDPETAVK